MSRTRFLGSPPPQKIHKYALEIWSLYEEGTLLDIDRYQSFDYTLRSITHIVYLNNTRCLL
jgi:hypothetical protein